MSKVMKEMIKTENLTLSDDPITYCVGEFRDESPTGNPRWFIQSTARYMRPNGESMTIHDFVSEHPSVEAARSALKLIRC